MNARPLTHLGVRCVNWGIQSIAGILLVTLLLPWLVGLLPGEFGSLEKVLPVIVWIRNAAVLAMLLGVCLTTAAPADSRVAPWALAILALAVGASLWPVLVYMADLPASFLSGPFGDFTGAAILLQAILFAGLLAALCGWIAGTEHAQTNPIAGWEKLASRATNLRTAGATYFAGFVGLVLLNSQLIPVQALRDPRVILLVTAVFLCWGLVLLVRFARMVWAVDREFARSTPRAEIGNRSSRALSTDRLPAVGIVAGVIALGGLAANQWASTTLAPDWTARHLREIGAPGAAGGAGGAAVGRSVPAMEMTTIDGETIRLSDLAGKVVVLNFWATWCPPCVAEIPDLVRLAKEIESEGGVVLGISDEDVDTIRPFVAARKIPYRIASGSGWPSPFDAIRAIPVTYVIDASGTIREEFVGGRSYEAFRRAFDSAKQPTIPAAAAGE